jgi:hypothetical protein
MPSTFAEGATEGYIEIIAMAQRQTRSSLLQKLLSTLKAFLPIVTRFATTSSALALRRQQLRGNLALKVFTPLLTTATVL